MIIVMMRLVLLQCLIIQQMNSSFVFFMYFFFFFLSFYISFAQADYVRNCCVNPIIAPIFFVIFVLMAQFVLVNVVVAVLMKHLEESHKQIEDDEFDMEELEREMEQSQKFEEEQAMCLQLQNDTHTPRLSIAKVLSLPPNFTYTSPLFETRYNAQRRQTLQMLNQYSRGSDAGQINAEIEMGEIKPKTKRRASSSQTRDREPSIGRSPNGRPKFSREISLDERVMMPRPTHKLIEMKRTSCDQLLLRDDKTPIITSLYPKTNIKTTTEKCPSTKTIGEKRTSSKESMVMAAESAKVSLFRRSSLKLDYANAVKAAASQSTTKERIHLSKAQSVSERSGSCRQLFKQHAMDDDAEMDESSLLLPVLNKPQIQPHTDTKNANETSLFNKTKETSSSKSEK